jgi:hypothetical protein
MHERTNIQLSRADRSKLEAVVVNRNSPQKHVWRANIVLLTAAGHGTAEIMQATGKAKTVIWRWQERFRDEGAAGLWRDKTRRSCIPPLSPEVAKRVVALTLAGPPPAASHWSGSAMAKAAGISISSVQRIWRAHGLQPHRVRQFKLSNDPQFAAKLREIVGLYVDPPDHAIVLSVDEKSQIQALDRTQPGLPMKKGRASTMTHDYKRHGVTTLFAALNVLEGKVIGQCMKRHRHQEFIRFLNVIEARVPKKKTIHVIVDNYATHKHPDVMAWLEKHRRFVFHFTPTSASWLNAIEGFFAKLTKKSLKRGARPGSRHGGTGFLGLLLPSQDGLLQIVKPRFDHAVEQRVLPVTQPRVDLRPVLRPQGFCGGGEQQLLFLLRRSAVDPLAASSETKAALATPVREPSLTPVSADAVRGRPRSVRRCRHQPAARPGRSGGAGSIPRRGLAAGAAA